MARRIGPGGQKPRNRNPRWLSSSAHGLNTQYPPPMPVALTPGRRCSRRAHRRAMRRDDFSRTLSAEPAYAIFDPWGAAICGASPRMKRKGFIDDENEEVSA